MDIEEFLLEMADSDECRKINYKRLAIREYIGIYYAQKLVPGEIDSFMIPFRDYVKCKIEEYGIDIDVLAKYMISTDKSNCALFAFTTRFKPKNDITSYQYYAAIARYQIISPFVCSVDMDAFALIVVSYVFDNLASRKIDISEIVNDEVFSYEVNQYGLSNINGASFRKDGLIYDGKGYYYNVYTNKSLLSAMDSMPAFARIITDAEGDFDILYRLDERLSMPESEYRDYTGVQFEKFYGPQFKFDGSTLKDSKTIIVHINPKNMAKLLMVIKKDFDQIISEPFWHIEIETLPYPKDDYDGMYTTTFLHGMYYPEKNIFTHIDFTKNQYGNYIYQSKYQDSQNGLPIDTYTESRSQHYKIWCIENGAFSIKMWYMLMLVSLDKSYQVLFEEIMN